MTQPEVEARQIELPWIPCNDAGHCDDRDCQSYLAGIHAIDRAAFDKMKSGFFIGTLPLDVEIAAPRLDLTVACNEHVVATDADFTNKVDNLDLNPRIIADTYSSTVYEDRRFSIALFRAIARMFAPDTYYFSKGAPQHVMVRATKGGKDVYIANLSDVFPLT